MLKLTIRPLAKSDIKKIWRYSHDKWGKRQADKYTTEIGHSIQKLMNKPEQGKNINTIREGYRQLAVQQHLVIYRLTEEEIDIVRVLSKRMNIERHF